MFPIDTATKDYNAEMVDQFDELVAPKGISLEDLERSSRRYWQQASSAGITDCGGRKEASTYPAGCRQASRFARRKAMQAPAWQRPTA